MVSLVTIADYTSIPFLGIIIDVTTYSMKFEYLSFVEMIGIIVVGVGLRRGE